METSINKLKTVQSQLASLGIISYSTTSSSSNSSGSGGL
jgi:hypothetical protein